jgi:hypothetical protein
MTNNAAIWRGGRILHANWNNQNKTPENNDPTKNFYELRFSELFLPLILYYYSCLRKTFPSKKFT